MGTAGSRDSQRPGPEPYEPGTDQSALYPRYTVISSDDDPENLDATTPTVVNNPVAPEPTPDRPATYTGGQRRSAVDATSADARRPTVVGTDKREEIKKGLKDLASAIIKSLEEDNKESIKESIIASAKKLCDLLKSDRAPSVIRGVARLFGGIFEAIQAGTELTSAVKMLVLDVVMVYEILDRLDQAVVDAGHDLPTLANQFANETAGDIHTALLRLALKEAEELIREARVDKKHSAIAAFLFCVRTTALAVGKLADVEAASLRLAKARDNFCTAVSTSRVISDYVKENVAQLRAEQLGELAPSGSILLKGLNGKAKLFLKYDDLDEDASKMGDSLYGCWDDLLLKRGKCQAFTDGTQPCKLTPVEQVFRVTAGSNTGSVLCVCRVHGKYLQDNGFLGSSGNSGQQGVVERKHPPEGAVDPGELDPTEHVQHIRRRQGDPQLLPGRVQEAFKVSGTYFKSLKGIGSKPWQSPWGELASAFKLDFKCSSSVSDGACCTNKPSCFYAYTGGASGAPSTSAAATAGTPDQQQSFLLLGVCGIKTHQPAQDSQWVLVHTCKAGATDEEKQQARRQASQLWGRAAD